MKWLHLKWIISKAFFITTICLALIASACTPAQMQQLEGLLQNIDTANGTLTITTKDGKTVTVTIASNSQVKASGTNTSVFALEPGTNVKVEERDGVARVINAQVANVQGTITTLQSNQVTIKPESGGEVTLNVTNQTKIKLESDQTGTLSDLKTGVKVEAKYDPQTKNAIRILVNAHEKAEIEGTITQISGSNVTIQTKRGLQATVIVDNNTSIRLERDAAGALSNLKVGLKVHAKFNPTTNACFEIKVQQGEEQDGQGKAEKGKEGASKENEAEGVIISVSGNSVTIQTEKGNVTFTVDGTRIELKGRAAGTIADLKNGVRIHVKINPGGAATQIEVQR